MTMLAEKYSKVIDQFSGKKVLVIGDFIIDVYIKGRSNRLSPEAPVPVVNVTDTVTVPGGAANTALNLRKLGVQVAVCSGVGTDEVSNEGVRFLEQHGIDVSRIVQHPERSALVKSRVVADGHVLIRFDKGSEQPIDSIIENILFEKLQNGFDEFDAVVISDYNKGIVTEGFVEKLSTVRQMNRKFLAVDSKRLNFFAALEPDLVKPNFAEALSLLTLSQSVCDRFNEIGRHGKQLNTATRAKITAVTLDEDGSLIFNEDQFVYRATAPAVSSPQVSGAGDTYISAFLLGYLCSNDLSVAADIATAASAIAITKNETASCTHHELQCYFCLQQKLVDSIRSLEQLCNFYRSAGKRIVFTNGCFDILHSGHVNYLNQARALGDILIVGINNDESIRRLKGSMRPLNALEDRIEVVAGLSAVTHVISFGEPHDDTPIELIKAVKPAYFAKGGDYSREKLPEAETVDEVGGKIVFIPHVSDRSTTRIIDKIQRNQKADGVGIA